MKMVYSVSGYRVQYAERGIVNLESGNMKILLTGSTGFIGRHIRRAMLDAGYEVICADRGNGVDFNRMLSVSDWIPCLESVDVVINAVGIIAETGTQTFRNLHTVAPTALFQACEEAGVKRVIQISALGADSDGFTPYQVSKKAADDVLRNSCLDWFVLRPSLVYGDQGGSTRFFRLLAKFPLLALAGGGQQLIQPVHVEDLVDVVLACIRAEQGKKTIDVAGPQVMTVAEWIQRLRFENGKPRSRIISVPYAAILPLSFLIQHIIPMITPDNLKMLQQGNTSTDQSMQELLGRQPRDVP